MSPQEADKPTPPPPKKSYKIPKSKGTAKEWEIKITKKKGALMGIDGFDALTGAILKIHKDGVLDQFNQANEADAVTRENLR